MFSEDTFYSLVVIERCSYFLMLKYIGISSNLIHCLLKRTDKF